MAWGRRRFVTAFVVVTVWAAAVAARFCWSAQPGGGGVQIPLPSSFKPVPTAYYTIYTDLPPDGAREASLRMTRMAEEYHDRTKGFSGTVDKRLNFYLFSDEADYIRAGGPPRSAGVFTRRGDARWLMAQTGIGTGEETWHTVQHEGFHQFTDATIAGELPTWMNEGLAEYFGESIWTGDDFVTGIIPPRRLKLLRERMAAKRLLSVRDMMLMSHEQWNQAMSVAYYDQAWSMAHFLAHGNNGKYQPAFEQFIRDVSKRMAWDKAWEKNFGSAATFEQKWSAWWNALPDDPTAELQTRATLGTLTSFVARAFTQKVPVDDLQTFLKLAQSGGLKLSGDDWLPPSLLERAADQMARGETATTFAIEPPAKAGQPPQVVAMRPDGTKLTAKFPARHAIPVKITITSTPATAVASAKPPKSPGASVPSSTPKPATPKPAKPPPTSVAGNDPTKIKPPAGPVATRPPAKPPIGAPPPPTATGEPFPWEKGRQIQVAGLAPAKEAFIKFVSENNVWSVDHRVVADARAAIEAAVARDREASLRLGSGMMKSGRTTQISVMGDQCFVTEFTAEQSLKLLVAPLSASGWDVAPIRRAAEQQVTVSVPKFEADQLDGSREASGTIGLAGLDRLEDDHFRLRIDFRSSQNSYETFLGYTRKGTVGAGDKVVLEFKVDPLRDAIKPSQPLVLFVDVVRVKEADGKIIDIEILSNTVAMVMDYVTTEAAAGEPAAKP